LILIAFCGNIVTTNIKTEFYKMQKINVTFKKLNENAKVPTYGSPYSAGADLYALCENAVTIGAGKTEFIHTGISLEIPEGVVGLIYARSGMACKRGVAPANKVGVIDSDYRGEICVGVINQLKEAYTINPDERIAQLVIMPVSLITPVEADELDETERGAGGFGSTGKA
jgi:dUTP pyrophosphatase